MGKVNLVIGYKKKYLFFWASKDEGHIGEGLDYSKMVITLCHISK